MNAKTLKALKASIAKWDRNAVAETPEDYRTGPADCALCRLFNDQHVSLFRDLCRGCPVMAATGERFCQGTPYRSAERAHNAWIDASSDMARHAAQACAAEEVAFLKSLLPDSNQSAKEA